MPYAKTVLDFELDATKQQCITLIDQADIIFCLDFNVIHRTKTMEPYLAKSNAIKVLIDHHQQPQENYFTYGISNTAKSSTAEMVYDFIIASGNQNLIDNLLPSAFIPA
jgi:phosphoesterase RecJ-like protein